MRVGALAAVRAALNVLFGVVPRAPRVVEHDGQKQARQAAVRMYIMLLPLYISGSCERWPRAGPSGCRAQYYIYLYDVRAAVSYCVMIMIEVTAHACAHIRAGVHVRVCMHAITLATLAPSLPRSLAPYLARSLARSLPPSPPPPPSFPSPSLPPRERAYVLPLPSASAPEPERTHAHTCIPHVHPS